MNWYLAKLVYRIISGNGAHTPQFEEQLRLVEATSKAEALHKAKAMGRGDEVQFPNHRQETVRWTFVDVCELTQLHELADGTEIHSRIEEREEGEAFEQMVQARAARLMDELNTPHLQQN